jgi:hypothetical protein
MFIKHVIDVACLVCVGSPSNAEMPGNCCFLLFMLVVLYGKQSLHGHSEVRSVTIFVIKLQTSHINAELQLRGVIKKGYCYDSTYSWYAMTDARQILVAGVPLTAIL